MPRRTKLDALATRCKLLDTAEHLFYLKGVSGTSLQDIALHAGTTRGAIYWHFKDKAELFNTMMERVTLPMEAAFGIEDTGLKKDGDSSINSVERIRTATVNALNQVVNNAQTRRVFEIATHQVEYTNELQEVRIRHLVVRNKFTKRFEQVIEIASLQMNLKLLVPVAIAAQGYYALIDGLIQNWLLDPQAFNLLEVGKSAMNVYLGGLGFLPHL